MRHFFLTALLFFCMIGQSQALVVEFRDSAAVEGNTITLGDIASINGNQDIAAALASRQVGQAPPPGESTVLDCSHIADSLTPSLAGTDKITWKGADSVRIKRLAQQVSTEKIIEIIDAFLAKNKDKMPNAEIRFVPAEQPLPFTVQTGDLDWEVVPSNPAIIGSNRFSLIFKVDGKVRKNMSVRGKIEAMAKVAIASEQIEKDALLQPTQFTMMVKDISELDKPCLNVQEIIGKKASRLIRSGAVLTSSLIETPPMVRRGESVKIMVRQGELELTALGTAQADGIKDQTIRVENASSKKVINGRVTAPGLVEVTL